MVDPTPRTPTDLDLLAEEWLDTMLDLSPELHVHLGRPGRESDYTDRSPDGVAQAVDATRAMLARVRRAEALDAVEISLDAELLHRLNNA